MIRIQTRYRRRAFSLEVDSASEGPVLGIFGRSGSGKTTLLHILAGLIRPDEVLLEVQGELLARRPGGRWSAPEQRRLALVPQDPLLFPHLSIRANLTFAPGAAEELESPRGQRLIEILRLGALLERSPSALSGGERQRVALGRAWLARPRMLLCDEPAASLDPELSREVLALFLEAKRELGLPMVFVTHRAAELLALADDCLVLEQGKVIAQGTPLEVLAKPKAVGVAQLVGVDNLLRLEVESHDEAGGVTLMGLGEGLRLATPLCAHPVGTSRQVGLYAEDLILCRERPAATSARNALPARITSTDPIGHEIVVTLQLGREQVRARITPSAASELGLSGGQEVVVLIKTTACHHLSG